MKLDNNFFQNIFKSAEVFWGLNNHIDSFDFILKDKEILVSIDSRTVTSQDIFLAMTGPNFDGHNFLINALEKGILGLIIEKNKKHLLQNIPANLLDQKLIIIVDDTYKTLIEMAKYWRNRFDIPVVGVTGSIGKTTTKEMLASILNAAQIPHLVSYKNQNNQIGLPLNILRLKKEDKIAVFELGINDTGEMDFLVDIVQPTIAVITTVGHVHIEGLGSLEGVSLEKRRIFKNFLSKNVGIIFGDNPLLGDVLYSHPIVKFGFKKDNNVIGHDIKILHHEDNSFVEFILKIYGQSQKVKLYIDNEILVHNALAAVSVAHVLGIDLNYIVKGLENFRPISGRFEKKPLNNNKGFLINDCYNAGPESMKASILAFDKMVGKGIKIAVLGDMLELGEMEAFWHKHIGEVLNSTSDIKELILVGERSKLILETLSRNIKVNWVENWQQALELLQQTLVDNSLILLKASHGMGFSNLVDKLS